MPVFPKVSFETAQRAELLPSVSATCAGVPVPQLLPGQSEGWPGRGQKCPFSVHLSAP